MTVTAVFNFVFFVLLHNIVVLAVLFYVYLFNKVNLY